MQTTSTAHSGALLTAILIVLALVAISRSPRKGRTALFILACAAGGFIAGALIGIAAGNKSAGGTLAALSMQVAGIAASINRMLALRKPKAPIT